MQAESVVLIVCSCVVKQQELLRREETAKRLAQGQEKQRHRIQIQEVESSSDEEMEPQAAPGDY